MTTMLRNAALAVAFLIGLAVGFSLNSGRFVAHAQSEASNESMIPAQSCGWVLQPMNPSNFYVAYLYNTRTGEAYGLTRSEKHPVVLKDK